jgi:hypothetical protein
VVREKEKADKAAERQRQKEERESARVLQLSQKRKKQASLVSLKCKRQRCVGDASQCNQVGGPSSAPPPKVTTRGRNVKLPQKFR